MSVNLSPLGGVAAQFFNNDGVPLAGGKIYTYTAGSTTPANTYTTGAGNIAHPNPIILDSAGRVPTGEIWLTDSVAYKFVIKDSTDTLIGTYDNIVGINSNFVNYTASQEIQTATAGQTVFTLTTMAYQPGTNSLSVFVDGVNQYGPGAQYAFTETSSTSVTFTSGLHVGASVKFTTAVIQNIGGVDATQVTYTANYTGAVSESVATKLDQFVSVKDFGALGDGVTDDTAAIRLALTASTNVYFPPGIYIVDGTDTGTFLQITTNNVCLVGAGYATTRIQAKAGCDGFYWVKGNGTQHSNIYISGLWFNGDLGNRGPGEDYMVWLNNIASAVVESCKFEGALSYSTASKAIIVSEGSQDVLIRNNLFWSNGGEDINFYGSDGSIYRCSAIGNQHYQPQGPCIEIEGRNGGTISGYQVFDVTVSGNVIRSNAPYSSAGDAGILAIGAFNANITNNIIDRRGTDGIRLIGCTNTNVINNIVRDMGATGYNGIRVTQDAGVFGTNGIAVNINISGNIVDNCENCGINIFGGETVLVTVQNFVVCDNICTNLKTGINATGIFNYSSSGNSFRSCSVQNYYVDSLSGAVAIMDAGNSSGVAAYPNAQSQAYISHVSGATLTLDISKGQNVFNVNLASNVTAINVTGTPAYGQKLAILFLQSGSGSTVTTTQANWTTNSVGNFQFPALTVPTLPGSAINGRWGYIEFVYGQNTVSPNKWVMTTSQANCG